MANRLSQPPPELEPWPKLWQNLRSTRETELADQFPAHVASAWIGNSVPVAAKHYLQVTEDHFKQAAQNAAQKPRETSGNDANPKPDPAGGQDISSNDFDTLPKKTTPYAMQGASSDGRYRTRTCDLTGVIRTL